MAMAAALPNVNIAGVSGEELAKPQYRATKFAVRLKVNSNGPGNSFISGPLILPSGVTLWIDAGVTLFATRDAVAFSPKAGGPYCANTAVSATKGGSSSNCAALISGSNLVNSAIVGDGSIDSRAYAEIVSTNKLYPLMKVDLTCSNTYVAYATGMQAADGTACDDGGTIVNSKSSVRNMTWWDLAYLGNLVENGRTGAASQSNFRMMVFSYVKNLTLYRITMNNSANFHFVPSGVDGLTVWGVKLQTPSTAAYANPVGNLNPLYTGALFGEDNVKNTDAFDPASASKPTSAKLTTGSATTSKDPISFDGYLKNVVFAYNYVSTGDDDIVAQGLGQPEPGGFRAARRRRQPRRSLRSQVGDHDRPQSHVLGPRHLGRQRDQRRRHQRARLRQQLRQLRRGPANQVGLRARRRGQQRLLREHLHPERVERAALHAVLQHQVGAGEQRHQAMPTPLFPNFHDIHLTNVRILGTSSVKLQGLQAVERRLHQSGTPAGDLARRRRRRRSERDQPHFIGREHHRCTRSTCRSCRRTPTASS